MLLVFHIVYYKRQQSPNITAMIATKELSTESGNSQQNIGECGTEITYGNCPTLGAANFTWYLNGSRVDYENNTMIYAYQEDSGILDILNNKAAVNYTGLYQCVTTFPGGLGSYITAATYLVLMQEPTTGRTTSISRKLCAVFMSTETSDDSLPSWVIAVIVVISVIAVGILIVVGLMVLQQKVGWIWFFRSGFASNKSRIHRSKSQYSEGKSDYFKSQSSTDQLIKRPVKRLSSKASQRSSKKASQIKG